MIKLPESNQPRKADRHETLKADRRRWYFVCFRCDAKWFAEEQEMPCPRCCAVARSCERLTPPWRSLPTSIHNPSRPKQS